MGTLLPAWPWGRVSAAGAMVEPRRSGPSTLRTDVPSLRRWYSCHFPAASTAPNTGILGVTHGGWPPLSPERPSPKSTDTYLAAMPETADREEMLTAADVSRWLKVGHNYPYVQL